jgi:hypothetical protein
MKQQRMRELLLGHALADGLPIGEVLRTTGGPRTFEAAAEVDGGRLPEGLIAAGIPRDEAQLAGTWPAALRRAQRRLARFPTRAVTQVQLVEASAYLCLVALLQAAALFVLDAKIIPVMSMLSGKGLGPGDGPATWFGPVAAGLVVVGPLLLAASIAAIWYPALLPGGERHRRRARQAVFAASLVEAGAPAAARAQLFDVLRVPPPQAATVAELELLTEEALSRAEAAQRRLVALTRGLGMGVLIAIAAAATGSVYHFLAWMPP